MTRTKTLYLCGAGGKGNIGAEAIFLAIVKLLQRRYGDARFIISSWYPERVRALLEGVPVHWLAIRKEGALIHPVEVSRSHLFVVCGDVSISESVVPILPIYYGVRCLTAKALHTKVLFLGIEAETIRRRSNLFALRHMVDRPHVTHILRNEESVANLRRIPMVRSQVLLGCEPALMLEDGDTEGFEYRNPAVADGRMLVGFGVRDFFTEAFRVNWLRMRLERRDTRPGEWSPTMQRLLDFTARVADFVADTYDAQCVFIPHHFLPEGQRVIEPDRVVAEEIIRRMKRPDSAVILDDQIHPFRLIRFYRRLSLVFSMRHHTSAFALLHHVPTFGYDISEKIRNFFLHLGRADMLIEPDPEAFDAVAGRIRKAVSDRESLSRELAERLRQLRRQMNAAMDKALVL